MFAIVHILVTPTLNSKVEADSMRRNLSGTWGCTKDVRIKYNTLYKSVTILRVGIIVNFDLSFEGRKRRDKLPILIRISYTVKLRNQWN